MSQNYFNFIVSLKRGNFTRMKHFPQRILTGLVIIKFIRYFSDIFRYESKRKTAKDCERGLSKNAFELSSKVGLERLA